MANDILTFCGTDTGTNLLTQSEYNLSTDRTSGNKPGIASAKLVNKSLRQSAAVASQMAQFISNKTGTDIVDNGVYAQLLAQFTSALTRYSPTITKYTSGSGTHNVTYIFAIATGSATIGATYTNNGVTYTVSATVASAVEIRASGNGAPLTSGTLTKSGGTGDTTLIFYAVRAPLVIEVEAVGGGGGGNSNSSDGSGTAGAGGDTTFGTTLITCVGGTGAGVGTAGGAGGAATATGLTGIVAAGARGSSGMTTLADGDAASGGIGGSSPLGGAGACTDRNAVGGSASANSGSGGAGAGCFAGGPGIGFAGSGGGAGGYVRVTITSGLLSTYAWAVGASGAAGTNGTSKSFNGGAGAAGVIVVKEIYQ